MNITINNIVERIKDYFGKLDEWKNLNDLLPDNFSTRKNLIKSGMILAIMLPVYQKLRMT